MKINRGRDQPFTTPGKILRNFKKRLCLLAGMACLLAPAQAKEQNPTSLFGSGHGIDHVGLALRDLDAAQRDFEQLGFKVFNSGGHFPDGLYNGAIVFSEPADSYLELMEVKEPKDSRAAEVANFAKKHEGAIFLGLNVSSIEDTYKYLKGRGFDVSDPAPSDYIKPGDTKPAPQLWYTLAAAPKPAGGKLTFTLPIFFIQYLGSRPPAVALPKNPNTARGIRAVWFAVNDEKAQLKTLASGGFEPSSQQLSLFGVRGAAVKAGAGVMVLLESGRKDDEVAKFLSGHNEGVMAVSIEVANLETAEAQVESATHTKLKIYDGTFGRSFLIPPEFAHGLWIETFQGKK